ncbi:MAG: dethiobiotin synthase [Rhabdochlamydiaceae bacterium]|nr:dethiobiotin synthase [Rhabdochlamydiaceae bacterium]
MNILIAGIGTSVGKTRVSALLTQALDADYWKPIQTGSCDSNVIRKLTQAKIHSECYHLGYPASPYLAAMREKIAIDPNAFKIPQTQRPIVIESAGGLFVPVTEHLLSIDLFQKWKCVWILVANHYLGSINHTLLSIEALKQKKCPLIGLIFNDNLNKLPYEDQMENEKIISKLSKTPILARVNYQSLTLQPKDPSWHHLLQNLKSGVPGPTCKQH